MIHGTEATHTLDGPVGILLTTTITGIGTIPGVGIAVIHIITIGITPDIAIFRMVPIVDIMVDTSITVTITDITTHTVT